MDNTANFEVIRQYLREQFPKHFIADFLEGARRSQVFRVDAPNGRPLHYVVMRLDFLLTYTADDLQQVLVSSALGEKLKAAGSSPVTLSTMGCHTEGSRAVA